TGIFATPSLELRSAAARRQPTWWPDVQRPAAVQSHHVEERPFGRERVGRPWPEKSLPGGKRIRRPAVQRPVRLRKPLNEEQLDFASPGGRSASGEHDYSSPRRRAVMAAAAWAAAVSLS